MKKILTLLIVSILFIPGVFADKNISNVFKIYSYEHDELNDVYYYYSQGSAVLLNQNTVLTNAHVVLDEENEVIGNYELCKTIDFKSNPVCFSTGDLLYYDISKDLALLKLDKSVNNNGVTFSKNTLNIGDTVTTYGYPANGGGTISFTTGKISGFDLGKFKIDADIDSGSSGGAAFDEEGNLIGITSSVVVGYTTSGRVISMEDIDNFIKKSGQITEYSDGISNDFQNYHNYMSLYIGKNNISNKYFELKNIKSNNFNMIDVKTTKNNKVFHFELESKTGDTSIDIKRSLTTVNNSNYEEFFSKLGEKIKKDKDVKFIFKELTLKGNKVYVVLNINKKSKVFKISFTSQGISFDIEGTLNNSKELNSALKLYFKHFEVQKHNYLVDSVSVGGLTVHKSEGIDISYGLLDENNYYSLVGLANYKKDALGLVVSQYYTFDEDDIEDGSTMEQTLEYFKNFYSEYDDVQLYDSGIVRNSYNKIFGYVAVKSDGEESIAYTVYAYNKFNDSLQYSFFVLSFDINDKNISQAVRNFVDSLEYTGDSVIPVDDKYNIKYTRHIK